MDTEYRYIRRNMWWSKGIILGMVTFGLAFAMRMLEWPVWQNPENRLGLEWLLATHDAYHWVAGAEGFEFGVGHPMSEMLRMLADIANTYPAAVAFWFPAIMASCVAVVVYAWVWALGSMEMGVAAGVLTSLAPGFLARTLLGYYDTDLVTLFFPLTITLAPACWAMRFLLLPQAVLGGYLSRYFSRVFSVPRLPKGVHILGGNPLQRRWMIFLAVSGILAWWTQEWHSMFPYLVRYNVCLLGGMALILAPKGQKKRMLQGALAYALPAVVGLWGLVAAVILMTFHNQKMQEQAPYLCSKYVIGALWLVVGVFVCNSDVLITFLQHFQSYVKGTKDVKVGAAGDAIAYPSVAQSIIEVQDLELGELFSYFHPWIEVAMLGFVGFVWVVIRRPGALFLLPLAVLGLLSVKLGGRMVMFGAPIAAAGLTLPAYWLLRRLLRSQCGFFASMTLSAMMLVLLGAPFLELIPAMSQGPILNRRHAEALSRVQKITPEDSVLWLWWDWGYAAHHFARRKTIADGAAHGGPSLYIPAAVFTTDSPRFARQLIKFTALHDSQPGNVFKGMNNTQAAELIATLKSPDTPLITAPGKQYVVVSFEMLRLGFWITTFGSWDFTKKEGQGFALSIVPQQLAYKLDTGEVDVAGNAKPILATSISVFEDGHMTHKDYVKEWFASNPGASAEKQQNFLQSRRNVHFLFNRVTGEKLVVDEALYNTLMVRLLVGDPKDNAEYFKLVYDNAFVRVYEVI